MYDPMSVNKQIKSDLDHTWRDCITTKHSLESHVSRIIDDQ